MSGSSVASDKNKSSSSSSSSAPSSSLMEAKQNILAKVSSYVPPPLHDTSSPLSIWRSVKGVYPASDMPEYPARILFEHCAWKGLQYAALAPLVWPLYSLYTKQALGITYRRVFIGTPVVGLVLTGGLLGFKAAFDMDSEGVDDRGYRIFKSVSQNHVDKYSFYGSLGGATMGAVFGRHGFSSVLAATSVGIAMGVHIHLLPLIEEQVINYRK